MTPASTSIPRESSRKSLPLQYGLKNSQSMTFMYGSGVFQTAAFVLGFRTSEFVHRPYKSRVLVPYSPLALLQLSPDNFQSQLLWGLSFWC